VALAARYDAARELEGMPAQLQRFYHVVLKDGQPMATAVTMGLPFTTDQFFEVFERYNHAVWPTQLLLLLLACCVIVMLVWPNPRSSAIISVVLAALWAWAGIVYHLLFFSSINPAAYAFAVGYLVCAWMFLWFGVVQQRLRFEKKWGWPLWVGALFIVYALVIYPVLTWLSGTAYLTSPTFGLPCPTTIFTIGVLAFLAKPFPRSLYVVPLLWSMIGVQGAFLLSVPQDLGLGVAGLAGVVAAWKSH
jgi:hypothetical protein